MNTIPDYKSQSPAKTQAWPYSNFMLNTNHFVCSKDYRNVNDRPFFKTNIIKMLNVNLWTIWSQRPPSLEDIPRIGLVMW